MVRAELRQIARDGGPLRANAPSTSLLHHMQLVSPPTALGWEKWIILRHFAGPGFGHSGQSGSTRSSARCADLRALVLGERVARLALSSPGAFAPACSHARRHTPMAMLLLPSHFWRAESLKIETPR